MAVSISDLVQRVRDLLQDTSSYQTTSTTTGTGSTVAVPDGALWVQGDVGEFQTGTVGYEQFWLSTAPTVNDLTVVRGYNGTTAESHSSGVIVIQNPAFPGRAVQQALTQSVYQLWPLVYKAAENTALTPDSTVTWYELESASLDIIKVRQAIGTTYLTSGTYIGYANEKTTDAYKPVIFERNLSSDTAATSGLRFPGGLYDATNDIEVLTKRTITGTTDIEDSAELPVAEAVVYLAAARLLEAGEVNRVSSGSDLEESGSVGTGSRVQTGAYFRRLGRERVEEIALRLQDKYRPMRFWR